MSEDFQHRLIDMNYAAFQTALPDLLPEYRNEHMLTRDRQVVALCDSPGDADRGETAPLADGLYSIQQVTDEPLDLGIHSIFPDLLFVHNSGLQGFQTAG